MFRHRYPLYLAFVVLVVSQSANAALGGVPAAGGQIRVQAKTMERQQSGGTSTSRYTVHERVMSSGTSVREYADARSRVFAVAWSGPVMPDMRELLGTHFLHYTSPEGAKRAGHARRTVQRGDLVVHSTGRMRAFTGQAYLASAVPQGVTINDLR